MRNTICLLAALVLLASSLAAASSQVNNITLSHQNGYTQAQIDVDGTVRFSHQTEVAKDGKPFRIIVDILKAEHHLGAKKFVSLPKCAVLAIRTSQYAINPEAVVRVVFDMTQESSYRVESNQNSVTIVFPNKAAHKFANWSTSAEVGAMSKAKPKTIVAAKDASAPTPKSSEPVAPHKKSPTEINSAINKDRMVSLASKNPPPITKPEPTKPDPKSTQPVKAPPLPISTFTPGMGQFSDNNNWADLYKNSPPQVKKTETTEVKKTKTNPSLASANKVAPPVVKPASKPETKTASVVTPKAKTSPTVASVEPATSITKQNIPTPKVEPKKQAVSKTAKQPAKAPSTAVAKVDRPKDKSKGNVKPPASSENTMEKSGKSSDNADSKTVAKVDNADSDKKSTSRFRRNPAVSKKIKGTMVAEFPRRLVVKYKTKQYRDPFATLINEAHVSNSPIEQKVPNVEGLRLVGIIESDGGKNSALLEDANGYGYILKTGDRVKKGYVLRIQSDRVYFQIFEYGWSRTLALHLED